MNKLIRKMIGEIVAEHSEDPDIYTRWREPVIGFAEADDPAFRELKKLVGPGHALPEDLLPEARSVIVFFLPFHREAILSNSRDTTTLQSSREWAYANIETNNLIVEINKCIHGYLKEIGHTSTLLPPTYNYDEKELTSDWSHRHIGYIAGVGTFGINNMLITDQGCCGRIGSIVTSLPLEASHPEEEEGCLFKYDGSCGLCANRCPVGSIGIDGATHTLDRGRCNEHIYKSPPEYPIGLGDACGKCMSSLPCSLINPSKAKRVKRLQEGIGGI